MLVGSTETALCLQADIHIFLREIYKMWVDCGLYPELNMEDVKDEIFDMATPADPLHITSQDLQVGYVTACNPDIQPMSLHA